MKKLKTMLLVVAAVAQSGAMAAETFGSWIAGGTACDNNSVQVINNGNSVSVLFDNFAVNMPQRQNGDGMSARKTCNFRITMTPPNGYYLANFRQVYSGGLIKSLRASGQLNIRYNIGSVVGNPLPIVWPSGVAIAPEDPRSLFTRTYQNNLAVANCGGSTVYGINMSFSATRPSVINDFLVGGLDSVDADFIQRLELIPEWALCRR